MRFAPKQYDKVILFFFVAFALGAYFTWQFDEQFDEDKWRSSPSKRYTMADDIIQDELLLGKSKVEVINMLGEPVDLTDVDPDVLNYKIGSPPSFSNIVREELIVVFENNRAIEVFRVRIKD